MSGTVCVGVAAIGGALTACAFPPWSVPVLAPVGVALLFWACRGRGTWFGAATGAVFGVVFFGITLWWLAASVALGAWIALTALQAGWLGLAGAGITLVGRLPGAPMWMACVWTAIELARSTQPWGGMPWARLGYTAVDTPWQSALSVLGVSATGTLIALMGALAAAGLAAAVATCRILVHGPSAATARAFRRACAWRARSCSPQVRRKSALLAAALGMAAATATAIVATAGGVAAPPPAALDLTVGIVQGGVPGTGTEVAAHHREVTARHLSQTRKLMSAPASRSARASALDLLVWPENATAVDPVRDRTARESLVAASRLAGAPLLAGSIVDGARADQAANQAIAWTPDGPTARYTKQHLVPFGEYVPFRSLASRISARVADIPRDMQPGPSPEPMSIGATRIALALCFDVAYDEVLRDQVGRGAELAVVQTSNAMFLGTVQPEQQWAITRARAVEVGRAVVVASINGISGVIGPDGAVVERLPAVDAQAAVVSVPTAAATTWAVRLGPWPSRFVLTAALFALLSASCRVRPRRRTPAQRPTSAPVPRS
nr:apolipoprotein N-acyltransferase [Nocardioides sp. IC4_145]